MSDINTHYNSVTCLIIIVIDNCEYNSWVFFRTLLLAWFSGDTSLQAFYSALLAGVQLALGRLSYWKVWKWHKFKFVGVWPFSLLLQYTAKDKNSGLMLHEQVLSNISWGLCINLITFENKTLSAKLIFNRSFRQFLKVGLSILVLTIWHTFHNYSRT